MSVYYKGSDGHVKCLGDDFLEHGGHKYLLKIGDGPNARYFYNQTEIEAFNKLKKGVKSEIAGIKRFANRDKNKVMYSPDGKSFSKMKYDKKKKQYKFGKKKKAARIERGMLKAYRIMHPNE